MNHLFLDSNALIKLYRPEKGSNWLQSYTTGKKLIISELALTECATTFAKHYRNGFYTKGQAEGLYKQVYQDRPVFQIIPYGGESRLERVTSLAFNLPLTLRIRALDAIQLAAAEAALQTANTEVPPAPFVFVSSDVQLLRAAQAQGFIIENPENYP